jgi:hypothetical protein
MIIAVTSELNFGKTASAEIVRNSCIPVMIVAVTLELNFGSVIQNVLLLNHNIVYCS